MAEYDFKDVAAFKGVWVFCEQRGGEIMPTDEELISRARILADELGEEVVGLTLGGKGIAEKAKVLGGYGADKIIAYESDLLDVYTTEPGIQVYCGNFLDGSVKGKKGAVYGFRSAVCLETQKYPDTPNKPEWPSAVLRPGEKYESRCIYKFSVGE